MDACRQRVLQVVLTPIPYLYGPEPKHATQVLGTRRAPKPSLRWRVLVYIPIDNTIAVVCMVLCKSKTRPVLMFQQSDCGNCASDIILGTGECIVSGPLAVVHSHK